MRNLVQLGDVFHFQNGRAFKKSEWSESGLPIIRIQNLNKTSAAFNYFSGEYDKRIEVSDGDLLFSWSGTVGSSFGPHLWRRGKGLLNQHIFRVRLDGSIDKHYAYYALLEITSEIEKSVSGAVGLVHVTQGKLKGFKIPLPALPEQKRIVAILDEAFAGTATAVANTEKNLANARELFESYLNSVFLKGAHVWTRRRLEEVCEKITVGHVGSMAQRYKPEGIPLLRSQNIRPFRVDLENVVYIDEEFHSELKKSALKPGDLGIVRTGYPGTAAVIPDTLPISNCSDLVIVRPGDQVLSPFLALVFNSTFGKQTVAGVLVGAAQKHFNVTAAKAALVPIPSREEQARVVIESSEVRQECEKLESICQQKLKVLAELKQSLLQRAFSGELTATPQEEIETALA